MEITQDIVLSVLGILERAGHEPQDGLTYTQEYNRLIALIRDTQGPGEATVDGTDFEQVQRFRRSLHESTG